MPHGKRGVQLKALIQDIRDLVQYVKSTKLRIAAGHPSETVRLFIRLIDQGRFTDAIELLPSALVQALGVEPLESILYSDSKEVRDRGGVERIEILHDSVTLAAATVDVNIRYHDGSVDNECIGLMNEKGFWRIDMLR